MFLAHADSRSAVRPHYRIRVFELRFPRAPTCTGLTLELTVSNTVSDRVVIHSLAVIGSNLILPTCIEHAQQNDENSCFFGV